jgi:hypothetical protein
MPNSPVEFFFAQTVDGFFTNAEIANARYKSLLCWGKKVRLSSLVTPLTRIFSSMKYLATFLFILSALASCQQEDRVSFNEDIRPIFNAKCIGCHGGVKQAGGFGLVFRENALRETDTGKFAIVPGRPGQSEIISRARHENEELRMPFDGPPLEEAEIELLERWIDQGAEWEEHWAYLPPDQAEVPVGDFADARNEIDAFVRSKLLTQPPLGDRAEGPTRGLLAPAPRAQKRELLRRVAFDLTGLPPSTELADAFMEEAISYESLVDSLLNSPRYGEHRAVKWLELARYADSKGFERDRLRSIWRYRDWVVRAYNEDMPYDRFIVEQLAGDLLPDPTEDQLVATGFHRNTMSNGEGGTENEEFRVAAVVDRVNTTWEVFQGTTMSCVQCHAHPYDPFTHEDFYTSYALFNNTFDHDHITEAPLLRTFHAKDQTKYQQLEDWIQQHADKEARTQVQKWRTMIRVGEPRIRPYDFEDNAGGVFTDRADEDYHYLKSGNSFALPAHDLTDVAAVHVSHQSLQEGKLEVRLDAADGPVVGTLVSSAGRSLRNRRVVLDVPSGKHRLYFVASGGEEVDAEAKLFSIYAIGYEPRLPGADEPGVEKIETFIGQLLAAKDSVTTPIMVATEGESVRKSYLFERGNWLVPGKEVSGGVPELLAGEAPPAINDRLDFARWLTSPGQPLTARVAVNRIWGELFGTALVATVEDLGSQGAKPHHQELLDYLALEFSGPLAWSEKALIRKIVLSATYQQSSAASPAQLAEDPYNELLARGPRKRLSAEQLRDQALAVSGLLSTKMYGPGVMPPQPDGIWEAIPFSNYKWTESEGEDRYRRTLYTYLRRSAVHPGLTTFDASDREFCLSRRTITNTPLQALMALNDPVFLEAAQALADGLTGIPEVEDQINTLYITLLQRPADAEEVAVLRSLYDQALVVDPDAGRALAVVANALLNVDEVLTLG